MEQNLKGVPETLLVTLWARAAETKHDNPIIKDNKAVEMVNEIEYDFSKLDKNWLTQIMVAVRTEILDNALTLQLTMPNLRRHGVVETRAPDSPDSIEALMATAALYNRFAYDAPARKALLDAFSDVDPAALKAAFLNRFDDAPAQLLDRDLRNGRKVVDLIAAVQQPAVQAKPAMKMQQRQAPGI